MAPQRPRGVDANEPKVEPVMGALLPEQSAPLPTLSGQLYAALDLGTNSCRMLIAQPKGSQFLVVDSFSKTVQLGAGLEASGKLCWADAVGCDRSLSARQQFQGIHQASAPRNGAYD